MSLSPFDGRHIHLRPFEPDDAEYLRDLLNNPALVGRRYLPDEYPGEAPLALPTAHRLIAEWSDDRHGLHLAVVTPDYFKLIGHAALEWGWDPHCPSVHVVLDPRYWKHAYGQEAATMLVDYAFNFTVAHNASIWIADWNEPGKRFARALGFHESGRLRRAGMYQGRLFDLLIFDMLRTEWLARRAAPQKEEASNASPR